MFVFDNSEDLDIATYEYRLYEEDQVEPDPANPGYYKLINAATINSGSVVPYSQGFNTANVFTVAVENSTTTSTSNVTSPVSYYGAVRAIDTSANASGWTLIGKTSTDTPLIDEQFIGSLTAAKITAGTIGAHTITLSGANSIIKSSIYNATTGWQIDGLGNATFNTATLRGEFSSGTSPNWFRVDTLGQIWSGADTYLNAASRFRVSNTGSLTATSGKIGPVNITSSTMNSQGSSPLLNPNNNYYRFDQFGDITVFSNPGSDVAGPHVGLFHKTTIVGEYITIHRTADDSFADGTTYASIGYRNSTNYPTATWQVSTGDYAEIGANGVAFIKPAYQTFYEHNRAYVNGNITATGTVFGAVKSFKIDHPLYPEKKLVHASIEGPTLDVFYRGQSQLINGEIEIDLPEYFEALTRKEERNIFLTARVEDKNSQVAQLAYSSIKDGKFKVFEVNQLKNSSQKFDWLVMARRSDSDFEAVEDSNVSFENDISPK
jgi:hypothetical protein